MKNTSITYLYKRLSVMTIEMQNSENIKFFGLLSLSLLQVNEHD